MNVQAKKLELVQQILDATDPIVLRKIEDVFVGKGYDWWDELGGEEKEAIRNGLAEAGNGELMPHEVIMKDVRAKYKVKLE